MPMIEKPLEWIGSSHKDLMALPVDVLRFFGFALSLAQAGDKHDAAKVLKGFGGAGCLKWWKTMWAEPTVPCIPSSLLRWCLSFIAFKKRASAASPRPRRTWTLFTPG